MKNMKAKQLILSQCISICNADLPVGDIAPFAELVLTTIDPENDVNKTPMMINFYHNKKSYISFESLGLSYPEDIEKIAASCAEELEISSHELTQAMIKINMWGEKAAGKYDAKNLADELEKKYALQMKKSRKTSGGCLVFFGDSQMSSKHWATHAGYPDILAELLPGYFKVINAGIGGNTTGNALNRIDNDVLKHKPDIVFICFGGNDARFSLPLKEYEENILEIIAKVRKKGGEAILMTPVNSPFWKTHQVKFEDYVNKVREIAQKNNIPLIDIYGAMVPLEDTGLVAFDDVHLSTKGHVFMAGKVLEGLDACASV